jgi:hypothetical protein
MTPTDRLLDSLSDLRAGEKMCKRAAEWRLSIESIPGSYVVRVMVGECLVATVEDPWLDRAIRLANDAFSAWRDAAEETRLGMELRASVGVAP